MKYAIPWEAMHQHVAVLGKTRSGKSSVMRQGFVEPLLDAGHPVCIIDPKGDWWGLKLSRSGRGPGYPVVIFGGDHGDVPINEHSGGPVADLVATGNRPCIIDLGGWQVGARTRFFIDFADTLFRRSIGERWLVIDEVHNFAPQGSSFRDRDRNMMIHWANRLASEGLGRGINLIAASQRPQKVHKDFLTSMESLIAMRVIHPLDRDAITDWIKSCGDKAVGKDVLDSLAGFKRGEAWVWSPEVGYGPERVQFPMFSTYDSFKPRKGDAEELTGWAAVDLDEVRSQLADAVKEAEANDPKALTARIIELEGRLSEHPVQDDRDDEVMSLRGQVEAMERQNLHLGEETRKARTVAIHYAQQSERLTRELQALIDSIDNPPIPEQPKVDAEPVRLPGRRGHNTPWPAEVRPGASRRVPSGNGKDTGLSTSEQKIVDAIAWWEAIGLREPAAVAVAFLAGYSNVRSGGFKNPRSSLHVAGLIEYPEPKRLRLTEAGQAKANYPRIAPSGEQFREAVLDKLPSPERKLLQVVMGRYPNAMDQTSLAAACGYSNVRSGGFKNPRSRLKTLGLVEYPSSGAVKAADVLFPELW